MFWLAEVFNGSYSADEIHRHEQWARRQRAEAVNQMFSATGRGLARAATAAGGGVKAGAGGIANAYRRLRRWRQKRAAIRELSGLSDYMLKDIGLHRGDIRPVVESMLDGKPETRTTFRVFTSRQQRKAPVSGSSTGEREAANERQRAA